MYNGTTNTSILSVFGYQVARTGLSEQKLIEYNIGYYTEIVMGKTSSELFKDSEDLILKCMFEKGAGKLLRSICNR